MNSKRAQIRWENRYKWMNNCYTFLVESYTVRPPCQPLLPAWIANTGSSDSTMSRSPAVKMASLSCLAPMSPLKTRVSMDQQDLRHAITKILRARSGWELVVSTTRELGFTAKTTPLGLRSERSSLEVVAAMALVMDEDLSGGTQWGWENGWWLFVVGREFEQEKEFQTVNMFPGEEAKIWVLAGEGGESFSESELFAGWFLVCFFWIFYCSVFTFSSSTRVLSSSALCIRQHRICRNGRGQNNISLDQIIKYKLLYPQNQF